MRDAVQLCTNAGVKVCIFFITYDSPLATLCYLIHCLEKYQFKDVLQHIFLLKEFIAMSNLISCVTCG